MATWSSSDGASHERTWRAWMFVNSGRVKAVAAGRKIEIEIESKTATFSPKSTEIDDSIKNQNCYSTKLCIGRGDGAGSGGFMEEISGRGTGWKDGWVEREECLVI